MADVIEALQRIFRATKNGEIEWTTSSVDDTFIAVVGNVSITIEGKDGSNNEYVFRILSTQGQEIGSAEITEESDVETIDEVIQALHQRAKDWALGTARTLDKRIQDIDDLDDLPF
mgnify:CR=1 FL=1